MRVDDRRKGQVTGKRVVDDKRPEPAARPEAAKAAAAKRMQAGQLPNAPPAPVAAAAKGKAYGWHDQKRDQWCLSKFDSAVTNRSYNRYVSQEDAQQHADNRKLTVIWE